MSTTSVNASISRCKGIIAIGDHMTIGIYCIRNTANNKRYIGSSKNIPVRFRVHKSRLRKNKHHSSHLQNSYNSSPTSFIFEVLEIVCNISDLEYKEQHWIDLYRSYDKEFGFNAVRTVLRTSSERQRERWAKLGQKEAQCIRMKEVCATEEWKNNRKHGFNTVYDTEEKKKQFAESKLLSSPHRKRVVHVESGHIYESIAQAAQALGVSLVKIRDSANGKRSRSNGGISFQWVSGV